MAIIIPTFSSLSIQQQSLFEECMLAALLAVQRFHDQDTAGHGERLAL